MADLPDLLDTVNRPEDEQKAVFVLRRAPRFKDPNHAAVFVPIRTKYDSGGIDALDTTDIHYVRVFFNLLNGGLFRFVESTSLSG